MGNTKFATLSFGYNADAILYPWRECLLSACALADGVFFCACDDKTLESALDLAQHHPKIHVLQHPWADEYFPDTETHKYRIQAVICNYLLDYIEKANAYDYVLKLDADECLCEWSFDKFHQELEWMNANNIILGKPKYRHFCPDFETTWPFIYTTRAVIARLNMGIRFNEIPSRGNADACAFGDAPEYQTSLEIHHFGKIHWGREREALFKERTFQSWYSKAGFGFPDRKVEMQAESGYLDYLKVFDVSLGRGEFQKYNGPQPKFIEQWRKMMEIRHEQFVKEMSSVQAGSSQE